MKYAYSTLACPAWTLEQMIDAAQRYGYDALELRLLDGQVLDPVADHDKIVAAVAQTRAAGLEVCALDTSCRLNYREGEHDSAANEIANWIALAAEVNVPLLRLFGGESEGDDAAADARVLALLLQTVPQASAAGVILMLETHDAFSSARRVGRVMDEVNSPAAAALWDTLHPYRSGESPEVIIAALEKHLAHVHIKDAYLSADGWDQALPGEGDVPLAETLAILRQHGYSGYLSVEWEKKWHPDLAEPEIALPRHIEWLRGLEQMAEV